jgi:hypothetical protein
MREEKPRWHDNALRYSGFLREGKSAKGRGSASISLPRRKEGETLAETPETLYIAVDARVSGEEG